MKRLALACALLLAFGFAASSGQADARDRHREREEYRAQNWWRYNVDPPPYMAYRGDYRNYYGGQRRPCRTGGWRGGPPPWAQRDRYDNGWHRGWEGRRHHPNAYRRDRW
ncbi:MAG: hypothetical protein IPK79_06100 [Vampirovibrionales bacterium]|nr:hypothetical protein [Vampirovibrionales bacterium]